MLFVLFLIALIDFVVFWITFLSFDVLYFIAYLVIHVILFFIFRHVYFAHISDVKYELIPLLIGLYIPGFGLLMVSLNLYGLKAFSANEDLLSSYDKHLNYTDHIKILDRKTFFDGSKTLSYMDKFDVLDEKDKKYFLIESLEKNFVKQTDIMKLGLEDSASEVQYYSAVSVNYLQNDYEENIKELEEAYRDEPDIVLLSHLVETYKEFIDQSILPDEIAMIHLRKLKVYVDELVETKLYTVELYEKVIEVYLQLKEYALCLDLLQKGLLESPLYLPFHLLKCRVHFEQKEFEEIKNQLETALKNGVLFQEKDKRLLRFWMGGDAV